MIFYFISPIGAKSPGLYETFIDTFLAQGHTITDDINKASIVFFDLHSGYLPYDWDVLNVVLAKGLPVVIFDAHDYHGNSTTHWYYKSLVDYLENDWAKFIWEARIKCSKFIWFMRKIQTDNDFPEWVYPYEYCLFPDHIFPLVSKEELNNRKYDICFIGAKSAKRESVIKGLADSGKFKIDCQFTEERIPHQNWIDRHRNAKFFLTSDGGGLSDERIYQLTSVSCMLRQRNNQLLVNDFTDAIECVKADATPSALDISNLGLVLSNENWLYDMYVRANAKLNTYYSWEWRANYALEILKLNGVC